MYVDVSKSVRRCMRVQSGGVMKGVVIARRVVTVASSEDVDAGEDSIIIKVVQGLSSHSRSRFIQGLLLTWKLRYCCGEIRL